MNTTNTPDEMSVSQSSRSHSESPETRSTLPTARPFNQFAGVSTATLLRRLRLGWQTTSSTRAWNALAEMVLAGLHPQWFNAGGWIAANLDLLHPPVPERDARLLTSLSITELKNVYQALASDYSVADWPEFAWGVLSDLLDAAYI